MKPPKGLLFPIRDPHIGELGKILGFGVKYGLGGKANTNPGKQNARFKGSKICATRVVQIGEEILVPYRRSYKFTQVVVSGWGKEWMGCGRAAFI